MIYYIIIDYTEGKFKKYPIKYSIILYYILFIMKRFDDERFRFEWQKIA